MLFTLSFEFFIQDSICSSKFLGSLEFSQFFYYNKQRISYNHSICGDLCSFRTDDEKGGGNNTWHVNVETREESEDN